MVGDTKSKILILLLALSLIANAYFVFFEAKPPLEKRQVQKMQTRLNNLQMENEKLRTQINQNNDSLKSYASQLDSCRYIVYELKNDNKTSPMGIIGFETLQGPAVYQKVQRDLTDPFGRQTVSEEGTLMDISVEIRPGKGRVLIQTTPRMGVVFQDAANTAVFVAENKTGKSLSSSDVIFSVNATGQVPGVDGSSAGALMTLITISAINNNIRLNNSITLTGTINNEGKIGKIGGIFEKAQAAKTWGKTLFLIPGENSNLVRYNLVERNLGGITIAERVPESADAKEYIEKNVGIRVEYVNTIDDVLKYF